MALSKVDFNNINVTPAASKALKWNSSANGFETGDLGGSMVLLSTTTASSSATIDITSGIDSTYKEYCFKFINKVSENYSISLLCEVVGVTPEAYYSHLNKGLSNRAEDDEMYKSKILEIHQVSKYRYGHRTMYKINKMKELVANGIARGAL